MEKNKHPSDLFVDTWNIDKLKKKILNVPFPEFQLDKIEFHMTSNCNLRCGFCYGKEFRPITHRNLDKDVIIETLKEVENINPFIVFSGLYSEPLLHPDFKEIIGAIGDLKMRFGIYTNAMLLNEDIMKEIIKAAQQNVKESPSYVSIDVSASMYANKLDIQLENIKKLKQLAQSTNLTLNATLFPYKEDMMDEIEETIIKLNEIGVDNIRLSSAWDIKDKHDIMFKELTKLSKLKENITIRYDNEFEKCHTMLQSVCIDSDGNVFPCPELCSPCIKDIYSFGNIKEEPLLKIFRGDRHRKLFDRLNPKLENCKCCPMDYKKNVLCDNILRYGQ